MKVCRRADVSHAALPADSVGVISPNGRQLALCEDRKSVDSTWDRKLYVGGKQHFDWLASHTTI